MRIWLAAMRSEKGDVEANLSSHLEKLASASSEGCDLILFPEMSLTGSVEPSANPERLIDVGDRRLLDLIAATKTHATTAVIGIAEIAEDGNAYIAQVVASEGRCVGVQRKRHLGDGEEDFSSSTTSDIFSIRGCQFGIAICAEADYDGPFDHAADAGAGLVLFPAAPGLYGRRTDEASWRRGFSWWETSSLANARRHATRRGLWIAMTGQAGSTDDEDFPGLAALVSPDGDVVERLPDWREADLIVDVPL